jgi:pimeloyl-ACP methyl ester carboxylesterase
MRRAPRLAFLALLVVVAPAAPVLAADAPDVWDRVEHKFASNDGVKIHYVTVGSGKTVLFLHGFPDFWYSWRDQMAALSDQYRTAAVDLRGYNQSDQPQGVEHYRLPLILGDVAAVVRDLGGEKVTLVGHDWGGAIAWRFAMQHPESVERLVILNLTHPKGYAAVVANPTEAQRANTEYARRFASSPPDGSPVPDRILAMGDRFGAAVGARYREAFGRSSYDGMLNYYRANYGQVAADSAGAAEIPNLKMPVLQFHGLKDTAVDKDGLKNTWDWIEADYTLVTIPQSGHFVQWEAAELVSATMKAWLSARD